MITSQPPSLIADLRSPNSVLELGEDFKCERSALAVSLPRSYDDPWSSVSEAAGNMVADLVKGLGRADSCYLFEASSTDQPDNRITRHKGAGELLDLQDLIEDGASLESNVFQSDSGIRFAALLPVLTDHLPSAVEIARKGNAYLCIADKNQLRLDAFFTYSYGESCPYPTQIQWKKLVASPCLSDCIVVRFTGAFDDPELFVDFFGSLQEMEKIKGLFAP